MKLDIYNQQGILVSELINRVINEGLHEYDMRKDDLLAGVYFCRLTIDDEMIIRNMILNP